jgi:hypothetical protein
MPEVNSDVSIVAEIGREVLSVTSMATAPAGEVRFEAESCLITGKSAMYR